MLDFSEISEACTDIGDIIIEDDNKINAEILINDFFSMNSHYIIKLRFFD